MRTNSTHRGRTVGLHRPGDPACVRESELRAHKFARSGRRIGKKQPPLQRSGRHGRRLGDSYPPGVGTNYLQAPVARGPHDRRTGRPLLIHAAKHTRGRTTRAACLSLLLRQTPVTQGQEAQAWRHAIRTGRLSPVLCEGHGLNQASNRTPERAFERGRKASEKHTGARNQRFHTDPACHPASPTRSGSRPTVRTQSPSPSSTPLAARPSASTRWPVRLGWFQSIRSPRL